MSKYTFAKQAIAQAEGLAEAAGVEQSEVLLALLISTIDAYTHCSGKDEARKALIYELDNLGGTLDLVNIRSR